MSISKTLRTTSIGTIGLALLAGCDTVVMSPSGDIAAQQANLIIWATILMLIVVVPVIVLTLWFAWRYRASNKDATYAPDWDHSTNLELVIWAAPLAIIIALGALTWVSTHQLDPYRPLDRIREGQPVAEDVEPLIIEVVAMDWKWLFFYPEQGIAAVNQLAAPVDRPIKFKITATTMMNSFYIPALAGQIYAMGGMETQLHAVINEPGSYDGFSANYSGAGFNGMRFKFLGMSEADFDQWTNKVKNEGELLSRPVYQALAEPSEYNPVQYYSEVAPDLYDAILNRCVEPGTLCMKDMMKHHGHHGSDNAESHAAPSTTPNTHDEGHHAH
ncbi:Cytochrome bo(3) ubiquinol oxidase subunit 2 [Zhongshania aliphaticivorans]|uniref:Ubiquinol oxidase subunit 2 n=2 Tax=Zhongshania aliphaticivorans TaxID=1470434 RepID=A0A5S9Q7D9_9GAMM|nr:Cytochrome bo(3) ubiquinol oxidase subunit 2 [Zhongshania aliphaticivorans]CAA0113048.1 Cytochrome bo(3) ubiquinol oxidase subunit 2 [Zhongshania aliphaticivorans]